MPLLEETVSPNLNDPPEPLAEENALAAAFVSNGSPVNIELNARCCGALLFTGLVAPNASGVTMPSRHKVPKTFFSAIAD